MQKSDKKRNGVFSTKILESMVFKKGGNYKPNECIWSRLLFGIYFSKFRENQTCQNLGQNDAITFFY